MIYKSFLDRQPEREEAELKLKWLYDELEKIDSHRKTNESLRKTFDDVRQRENTETFLSKANPLNH